MKYFLLILFFILGVNASETSISGQIRPRSEYRNGFKTLNGDERNPAFFTEQRTRINFKYEADKILLAIKLQDVRIWGGTNQIYKADPSLNNVFEAWGQYNFNQNFAFKIGRQEWNYDNERFLGGLGWASQGRSHDGLVLKYKKNRFSTDLGLAYNQNTVAFEPGKLTDNFYNGAGNYKSAIFLRLNQKFDNLNLTFFGHNDGRQVQTDSSMAYRQTLALITSYNISEKFRLGGEYYIQIGEDQNANELNAFMFNAFATYKTKLTPLTLAIDYLSGTNATQNNNESFNPLYGTNHKFYGFMDYFYVGNFHGQNNNVSGLVDLYLNTKWKLFENHSITANFHYFSSPVELYTNFSNQISLPDLTESDSRYLGTEIDLVYNLKLNDDLKINLGYSQMFASEQMELVKSTGSSDALQNWVWLMIDFHPTIFSSN